MKDRTPRLFDRVDRMLFKIIRCISYLSAIALVGIMFVAFFNVLGEKLFKTGIPMSTELVTYLHIPVVFLAASYVTLDTGHTKIDLLSSHFPAKLQKAIMTLGYLLGAFICAFIGYRGFVRMLTFIARHKKSSVSGMGFDLWPFALILAIGFTLMCITFLWCIAKQYVNYPAADEPDKKPPVLPPDEGGEEQ